MFKTKKDMQIQLFLYKDLAIHFYYSEESIKNNEVSVKKLYLVFNGLPNFIDKDFFQDKVNKNTAFMSVYYFGTWLSGGEFTPESCKKSVEVAVEFAKKKIGIKSFDGLEFKWNFDKLSIIGYSFAGNTILNTKLNKKDINEVLLYSPLIYVNKNDSEKIVLKDVLEKDIKDAANFLSFLQRGFKFTLRGVVNKVWNKYFSGQEEKSIVKLSADYPQIRIFHGKADHQVNYLYSEYFTKTHSSTTKLKLYEDLGHTKDLVKVEDLV